MYVKLTLFTLLGCAWLQAMEKGTEQSLLNLLTEGTKSEVKKVGPSHLELLPADMQRSIIETVAKGLLHDPFLGYMSVKSLGWASLKKDIVQPLGAYLSEPIFLKNIGTVISTLSEGDTEAVPKIAASLDIPAATEWLKAEMAKNPEIKEQAQKVFAEIIKNKGKTLNTKYTPEDEKREQKLREFLYKVAENLIKAGVDINTPIDEYFKSTPLMKAAYGRDLKMVELLLKYGANLTIKNVKGHTVLEEQKEDLIHAPRVAPQAIVDQIKEIIEMLEKASKA